MNEKITPERDAEMRIQALFAAISRRNWHDTEVAASVIRDHYKLVKREKK